MMTQKNITKKKAAGGSKTSEAKRIERRIERTLAELSSLGAELEKEASRAGLQTSDFRLQEEAKNPEARSPQPEAGSIVNVVTVPGNLPGLDEVTVLFRNALQKLMPLLEDFQSEFAGAPTLSGKERQRLFGVRSRKYGFITKADEIIGDNPAFLPPNFSSRAHTGVLAVLQLSRQLTATLAQFFRLADDIQLTFCDVAYRDALGIYRSLQEQSRRSVLGADELFQDLRQFFTLHRRNSAGGNGSNGEPTLKELERDARRLLHGKADGAMTIVNESPHTTGGVREVEVRD